MAGEFPDNLTGFKILSPSRFSLTFDHAYSSSWLYNEFGQIIPVPQHAWDRESANGPVGNYDLTSSGATAVNNFLLAQNKNTATFATNPLWQVVDGPWKISQYAPVNGDATFVRNTRFSGPVTGSIHQYRLLSSASDTAEFDALLSASGTSLQSCRSDDAAQASRAAGDGYSVKAWPSWDITCLLQLRLTAGRADLPSALHPPGDAAPCQPGGLHRLVPVWLRLPHLRPRAAATVQQSRLTAGAAEPVSVRPGGGGVLLRAHGWQVTPNGTDTCTRPGSGASQCGAGVASGAKLSFPLLYANGTTGINEEVAALQSSFATAGIKLAPSGAPFGETVSNLTTGCAKSNCWQLGFVGLSWFFDPGYNQPDGAVLFGSNAPINFGAYSDSQADSLIAKLGSAGGGGVPAYYSYENYLAKQLPGLWMPQLDTEINAVANKLKGAQPTDPLGNIYPEDWYFVK